MLEQEAANVRLRHAAHLVALLGRQESAPPPAVLHPLLEAAPVTVGRPGKGGRRRRIALNTVEGVLNELEERYGEGKELRKHGHILRYFEIDCGGDGTLMARLSGNDINRGETISSQLDPQHAVADELGLRARWVIVELNADRNVAYEQRMGLALVRDLFVLHGLEWVSWRGIDRIGRDQMTNIQFCRWLQKNRLRLYLARDSPPLVDWQTRKLEYAMRRLLAENEADSIVNNTTDGLRRRYLEKGRGWPGLVPFGFMRGPRGYLIVDEDQWEIVERIYELYLSSHPDGRPFSIRDTLAQVRADGLDITYYVMQRVLSDEVYVTGRLQCTYKGKVYDVDPISLNRPISRERFSRAQAQRGARRGKNSVTPYGYFALNHIKLVHGPCQDVWAYGERIRLSAYLSSQHPSAWEKHRYAHSNKSSGCQMGGIAAPPLERAVIEAIHLLAEDEDVRQAWIANARGPSSVPSRLDAEANAIEAKLHRQRHRHADLLARFVSDDGAHGDAIGEYADLAGALSVEIARLEQRLARAKRAIAPPPANDRSSLIERFREDLPVVPPLDEPARLKTRVELLRACVSRVVVHDDLSTGRVSVEIFGPLIPPTAPLVTFLPGEGVDPEKLIGKTVLADQFLSAWKSPPLPVAGVASWCIRRDGGPTLKSVAAQVRAVHSRTPPDPMFKFGKGKTCAWKSVRHGLGLPGISTVVRLCNESGLTPTLLVRAALSPREIVEGRRAQVINAAEWYEALALAFESGLRPTRGWHEQWLDHCWPKYSSLVFFARRNGMLPAELLAFAFECWSRPSDAWQSRITSVARGRDAVLTIDCRELW